jgi:alpha-L-glutamate ligase-like protein
MLLQMRGWDRLMGMNARNEFIARHNPPAAVRLVNDKFATKAALQAAGISSAPTLRTISSRQELGRVNWAEMPDTFAVKPNQSMGGSGILLAAARLDVESWCSGSGRPIPLLELKDHVRLVIDGEFSPRARDIALFEPLLIVHPELAELTFQGLPDVRVICIGDKAIVAMLRLPTSASGGRANLHQKAIGAAVDLDTGRISRAWLDGQIIAEHPDTGAPLAGVRVPEWADVLDLARRCAAVTNLHYLGADVVVDRSRGPLILEVNARPGLQIQNVTGQGLLDVIEAEVIG